MNNLRSVRLSLLAGWLSAAGLLQPAFGRECGAIGMPDCPPGSECHADAGICVSAPEPCKSDEMCPAGQVCLVSAGLCQTPIGSCNKDPECGPTERCSPETARCKPKPVTPPAAGCSLALAPSTPDHGLVPLSLALLVGGWTLCAKGRRRKCIGPGSASPS